MGGMVGSLSALRIAAERISKLEAALAPFAAFAALPGFEYLPADAPMTQGSRMAARQVTVADFRRAREAYEKRDA